MMKDTNATTDYIKAITGKFDLDTVFLLDQRDKNISKLNAIVKCKNLVFLNVARNKITSISGMDGLKELTYLDLSFNQISSIDGLEYLFKLRTLNLVGNKIDLPKNFSSRFKGLAKLEKLLFQEINQNSVTANPICKISNYRVEMFKIFINLKSLDGIRKECEILCLKDEELDKNSIVKINYDDLNFNFKEKIQLNSDSVINKEYVDAYKTTLGKKYFQFQKEIDSIKQNLK